MLDDADRTHNLGKAILNHYSPSAFAGKKVLDLGGGNGDLAATLARHSAICTVVDARKENIALINKKHPFLKTMLVDLEHDFPFEERSFDFCLSLGVMSHLASFDKHIENIASVAENVVLETEVLDSHEANVRVPIYEEKSVKHLSYRGEGSLVSATNIQNRLSALHATYKRLDDGKLNHGQHRYDWQEQNVGRKYGNSRMWFIRRDAFWANKPVRAPLESQVATPLIVAQEPEMPIITRVKPIQNSPQYIASPSKTTGQPLSTKFRTRLFYNYYVDSSPHRKQEIDLCLQKNIDNRLFDIIILEHHTKPTFNFFFEKINNISGDNDINIICNSDIFFDNSLSIISDRMQLKDIYALSPWNWNTDRNIHFSDRSDSQNAWIIKGKIENVNGNFQLGKPNCDGRIAHEFREAGYNILNPSKTIKTYHVHSSGIRNYTNDDKIDGPILLIEPTGL